MPKNKDIEVDIKIDADAKRKAGYKPTPETDMSGHGFRKILNWQQVLGRGDKWFLITYQFEATKFPCHKCKTSDYIWLSPQRTGVYVVCIGCQTTTGPISLETGVIIDDKQVSPEQAYQVFVKRGLHKIDGGVPKLLINQLRTRRGGIRRKTTRKDVETY